MGAGRAVGLCSVGLVPGPRCGGFGGEWEGWQAGS